MSVGAVNKQTGDRIPTAGMPAIDDALDLMSVNPVQNAVITAALALKQNATDNNLETEAKTIVGAINEHEGDIGSLKSGLTNVDVALDVPDGAGKNRIPLTIERVKSANTSGVWVSNEYTLNGVTFTFNFNDNGAITSVVANGLATDNIAISLRDTYYNSNVLYTLTGCPAGGGDSTYRLNAATLGDIGYDDGNGATYSYTDDTTHTVSLRVYNGYNAQNVVFRPMVRLASVSDSTFEPYVPSVGSRISYIEQANTIYKPKSNAWSSNTLIYNIPVHSQRLLHFIAAASPTSNTFVEAYFVIREQTQSVIIQKASEGLTITYDSTTGETTVTLPNSNYWIARMECCAINTV